LAFVCAAACSKAASTKADDEQNGRRSPESKRAFYGTEFDMTPEEVGKAIPIRLLGCGDLVDAYAKDRKEIPFDFRMSCEMDGMRLSDRALVQRTTYKFARGLQLFDNSVDAGFEFRDGKLYGVSAEFDLEGYANPAKHADQLFQKLVERLTASYGPGNVEGGAKEYPHSAHHHFALGRAAAWLWTNPDVNPPVISLTIWDKKARDAYEAQQKAREGKAL
jgi:hypothetical protein